MFYLQIVFFGPKCRISLPQSCTRVAVFGNSKYIPSILLALGIFNHSYTTVLSALSFWHTKSKKNIFHYFLCFFDTISYFCRVK